jgi:alkanesulfonate monooxygenase SsuD/methylene tetrahydromethanopterin reductase-like flavin-dependent oxidoreductase (luciferase family)
VRARVVEPVGPSSLAALEELVALARRAGADAVVVAPGTGSAGAEAWVLAGALAVTPGREGAEDGAKLGPLGPAIDELPPALLAKLATTLDVVSGGRALCGVVPDETRDAGRYAEALEVCRALLTVPSPSFAGRHFRLEAAANEPRMPHPPGEGVPVVAQVPSGEGAEALVRAAATFADAVVLDARPGSADAARLVELAREAARRSGRTGGRPSLLAPVPVDALTGGRSRRAGRAGGEGGILGRAREAARTVVASLAPGTDGVVVDTAAVADAATGAEVAQREATALADALPAIGAALREALGGRPPGRGPAPGRAR